MSIVNTLFKTITELDSDIDLNNLNDIFRFISILKKKSIWSKQLSDLFHIKINRLRNKIKKKQSIKLHNHGLNYRDFTFVGDVVKIIHFFALPFR